MPSISPQPRGAGGPAPATPSTVIATPASAPERENRWATLVAMVAFAESALLWLAVTLFLRYRRMAREGVAYVTRRSDPVGGGADPDGDTIAGGSTRRVPARGGGRLGWLPRFGRG
jgi:hypothetical protein